MNTPGNPTKTVMVSIIICTYNRAELLHLTLEALAQLPGIGEAEVLVIDNNSSDHTEQTVTDFMLRYGQQVTTRYVFESRQGLSAARNTGIHHAEAELIAFLDDDAIPDTGWLTSIVDTFRRMPELQAMGGPIRPRFENGRPNWLIKPFELPYTIVDLGESAMFYPGQLHPCGANMAFRKLVFSSLSFPLELGRVGSTLISGEETWIFSSLRKSGGLILYHPSMMVEHFVPASRLTAEWISKRYYYQGVSNGLNGSTFTDRFRILTMVGARLAYNSVDALFARSEGRRLLVACRFRSIRGTLDAQFSRTSLSSTG